MDVIRTAQDLIRFAPKPGTLKKFASVLLILPTFLTAAARWSEFLKTRHCSGTVFKQQRGRRL